MVRSSLLLGAALSLWAASAQAADTDLFTAQSRFTVYHVFTGPDGKSHVDTKTLEIIPAKDGAKRLIDTNADKMKMGMMPDGMKIDFHVANHRTILMPLQGTLIIDVGDGKSYRLVPGNMALAEDRTGRGHISACEAPTGTRQCMTLQINLKDEDVSLQPTPR